MCFSRPFRWDTNLEIAEEAGDLVALATFKINQSVLQVYLYQHIIPALIIFGQSPISNTYFSDTSHIAIHNSRCQPTSTVILTLMFTSRKTGLRHPYNLSGPSIDKLSEIINKERMCYPGPELIGQVNINAQSLSFQNQHHRFRKAII